MEGSVGIWTLNLRILHKQTYEQEIDNHSFVSFGTLVAKPSRMFLIC